MTFFSGRWGVESPSRACRGSRSSIYWRGRLCHAGAAGIWIDAFPEAPSQIAVLRNMYEEFRRRARFQALLSRVVGSLTPMSSSSAQPSYRHVVRETRKVRLSRLIGELTRTGSLLEQRQQQREHQGRDISPKEGLLAIWNFAKVTPTVTSDRITTITAENLSDGIASSLPK